MSLPGAKYVATNGDVAGLEARSTVPYLPSSA